MGQIQSKHIIAGGVISALVIGAAGLAYYYNEDMSKPPSLPQNLSTEEIINILQDLRVEFTPTLIHWFQVYQQLQQNQRDMQSVEKAVGYIKEKGKTDSFLVQAQVSEIEAEICKKHNITKEVLDCITGMDSKDPKIKDLNETILAALEATTSGRRPNLKLQIPKQLTKEVYLLLYRRLLMGIRHNHYVKIREKVEANGGVFEKNMIKDLGQAQSNQEIRGKVFEYYKVPKVNDEDYHRTLKKAFYLYYEDKEFQRQVETLQKHNHQILQKIIQGDQLPEIQKDPFQIEDDEVDRELQEASKQRAEKFQLLLEKFSQQGGAQEGNPLFQLLQGGMRNEAAGGKDEPTVQEVKGKEEEKEEDEDYEDIEDEGNSQEDQDLPRREDELKKKDQGEEKGSEEKNEGEKQKEEENNQEKEGAKEVEEPAKESPKKEQQKEAEPKKDASEADAFDQPIPDKANEKKEQEAKPDADAFDAPDEFNETQPKPAAEGGALKLPKNEPAAPGDAFDELDSKPQMEGDALDEPDTKAKVEGDAFDN